MRTLSPRVALVLVGVLVPIVAVELALRLFGPFLPGNYNTGTFLTTHPAYGRFHVPRFDGWVKTSEYTSRVTTNALGLRGPDRPYEKPAGAYRVMLLGDSFVEAAQVDEQQGIASQLEAALNEGKTHRVEVLNAGIGGWGTGQQYVYLAEEGFRYSPDLVVVALYLGNDIYDNSYALQGRPKNPHEPYFVFESDGTLRQLAFRPRRPEETDPLTAQLRTSSLLWNVFETGVIAKLVDDGEDPQDLRLNRFNLNKMAIHGNELNERAEDAWRVTAALLRRMSALGAERGARTAIVAIPAAWQVYTEDWDDLIRSNNLRRGAWSPERPNRDLADRSPQIDAPILDLLPVLRSEAARTSERLYYPSDKHWTPSAHVAAAKEIASFLARSGLTPGATADRGR